MAATNFVLVMASLLFAGFFFHPKLLRARRWQATVTPLASIIGSGFLVAGPLLAHAAGRLAWAAMIGLCAVGYLFGSAIRYNIAHVEPKLRPHAPRFLALLERASDFALALAYFVSVAYYLNLFAAFALRLGDATDPFWIRVAATLVIAIVGLVGLSGGLKALEKLEIGAVGLKLALIGGLFSALILANGMAILAGGFTWIEPRHETGTNEIRVLLGLAILVQGFETSRYLGHAYDAKTRIRTMRNAQWISTAIYAVFVLLITSYFTEGLPPQGGETAIIDMLMPLGAAVAPLIIVTALASQFSAAVADMNGAGGLLAESSKRRLEVNLGNLATALAAIAVTWVANIYEIITIASKIFVFYYALQSAEAAWTAWGRRDLKRAALFSFAVLLALAIVLFAIPAEA